ncbi:MAG: hypothetical protein JJW00_01435 [Sulfurimonas sp.]|nr:hypothetical protein [Sulfurimonas sp.]
MSKFYFYIWLRWASRVSLCSIMLASVLSLCISSYIYLSQGMRTFNMEVFLALKNVFIFWFPISWSLALLIALFRSLKYLFNTKISGYEFKLYSCDMKDTIEDVGYGDLLSVWRRWLMLMVWLVGSLMIVALAFTHIFSSLDSLFSWFSIYWLYGFILASGYFSFILMSQRCKRVRIVKC